MQTIIKWLRDEEAATAVEYSVMLALILLAVVSAVGSVGGETAGMWDNIDTRVVPILNGDGAESQ